MTSASPRCDDVRGDLGELALGVLDGRARARALGHVTNCAACRLELEALSSVSDALVSLAPEGEPSLGFETRLVQRWRAETTPARRTTRRRASLVAAALALLVGGSVLGHRVAQGRSSSATSRASAPLHATLVARGHDLGQVWLSEGTPSWIYVSLHDATWSGWAWCRVTLKNGHVLNVGDFAVRDGYGAWAARVPAASGDVRTMDVTDATGHVIASAVVAA